MKVKGIIVESPKPPTIEVDWEALAAYIRFRAGKVAQTVPRDGGHCFIAVDLDSKGRVLGVEVVGETQIEIGAILKKAHVSAPNVDFSKVRYVRPNHMAKSDEQELVEA
jgi:uncharacterized protein YuzE